MLCQSVCSEPRPLHLSPASCVSILEGRGTFLPPMQETCLTDQPHTDGEGIEAECRWEAQVLSPGCPLRPLGAEPQLAVRTKAFAHEGQSAAPSLAAIIKQKLAAGTPAM